MRVMFTIIPIIRATPIIAVIVLKNIFSSFLLFQSVLVAEADRSNNPSRYQYDADNDDNAE